jgi:regulation of enolase protein 1 (concanavalin A-like superfamily)
MRYTLLFTVLLSGCTQSDSGRLSPEWEPPIDWGTQIDPDGDCVFEINNSNALTITLPATDKDLSIERKRVNAPRTLRAVSGNFVATVRVRGIFKASTLTVAPDRASFVGAGLVLMGDDQSYARLERAAMHKNGTDSTYVNWETRQNGNWVRQGNSGEARLVEMDVMLRLFRRGAQLRGAYSQDAGVTWEPMPETTLVLPDEVKVGVVAVTTGTKAFKPTFDRFSIDPLQ